MPAPTIARLNVEIKLLDANFKSYPCPRCGTESPRHDSAVRHAIDLHLDHPVVLQIKVGCYRCPACVACSEKPCFRTPLPFIEPGCIYVTRARQKLVEAIELDGMKAGRSRSIALRTKYWRASLPMFSRCGSAAWPGGHWATQGRSPRAAAAASTSIRIQRFRMPCAPHPHRRICRSAVGPHRFGG